MNAKTREGFTMMRYGLGTLMAVIALAGCASDRSVVLPRNDGAYEIIATSQTEIGAYQRADQSAEKTCKKLKKQFRIHDRRTVYQGAISPNALKLTRSLSAPVYSSRVPPAESDEDYKVTILVTCV